MKYARYIRHDQAAEDLEATLKDAGFYSSLISYAEVIANVLAGEGYLSKKSPGFKRIEIRDRIQEISNLTEKCRRLSKDPIINSFYDEDSPFKSISDKLDQILNLLKAFLELADKSPIFPGLNKRPRPVGTINQILIMWIPGMTDRNRIVHWQDLKEMSRWFSDRLCKTKYFRNISPASLSIKALQKLHTRLTKNILMFKHPFGFQGSTQLWDGGPRIGLTHGGIAKSFFPISSIEFYPDRIKTIFSMDEVRFVRETVFGKSGAPTSTLHPHNLSKEESENILLEIPGKSRGQAS